MERLLAKSGVEAGIPVTTAGSKFMLKDVIKMTYEDRNALDADLAAINEAQRIGLETGSHVVTNVFGR